MVKASSGNMTPKVFYETMLAHPDHTADRDSHALDSSQIDVSGFDAVSSSVEETVRTKLVTDRDPIRTPGSGHDLVNSGFFDPNVAQHVARSIQIFRRTYPPSSFNK